MVQGQRRDLSPIPPFQGAMVNSFPWPLLSKDPQCLPLHCGFFILNTFCTKNVAIKTLKTQKGVMGSITKVQIDAAITYALASLKINPQIKGSAHGNEVITLAMIHDSQPSFVKNRFLRSSLALVIIFFIGVNAFVRDRVW